MIGSKVLDLLLHKISEILIVNLPRALVSLSMQHLLNLLLRELHISHCRSPTQVRSIDEALRLFVVEQVPRSYRPNSHVLTVSPTLAHLNISRNRE